MHNFFNGYLYVIKAETVICEYKSEKLTYSKFYQTLRFNQFRISILSRFITSPLLLPLTGLGYRLCHLGFSERLYLLKLPNF